MSRPNLLVVAGEASGDRIAGLVVKELAKESVRSFGVGGSSCREAGLHVVANAEEMSAMGVGDVLLRLPQIARAMVRLLDRAQRTPPRAALLVNFTELNQRIGRVLRARGVRVLWCVAPQVWAWRPRRIGALHDAVDRLAVILPFEEALWRNAGYDARYVGHPSLDVLPEDRATLRARLGIPPLAPAVAVLPGSRAGEIDRLGGPLFAAAAQLRAEGADAVVLLAPGLDTAARTRALEQAHAASLTTVTTDASHGAASLLGAFDAALCASGTASLEAALAGAAPVVACRLDRIAYTIARRLVRTPHVALPNVILGRRAFPELIQDDATPSRIAAAARDLLAHRARSTSLSAELRSVLAHQSSEPFGARVAEMLRPWFSD